MPESKAEMGKRFGKIQRWKYKQKKKKEKTHTDKKEKKTQS